MKPHHVNELNNFIAGWYMEDVDLINTLLRISKDESRSVKGMSGFRVNEEVKKSLDQNLGDYPDLFLSYCKNLELVIEKYSEIYKYSISDQMAILEGINVQYYKKNDAYYKFHFERTNSPIPTIYKRHLVFITYLNDVDKDGETEFYYQQVKVKPEKGLTILFPADWTFTHKGIPSEEEKSIVTGWIHLL